MKMELSSQRKSSEGEPVTAPNEALSGGSKTDLWSWCSPSFVLQAQQGVCETHSMQAKAHQCRFNRLPCVCEDKHAAP